MNSSVIYTKNDSFEEVATFEHEGKQFTNGGSCLYPESGYAAGYLSFPDSATYRGQVGVLKSWDGKLVLGTAKVVSCWRVHSYVSSHMLQVECVIRGKTYTGRSAGNGMLWRGRVKKA